MSKPHPTIAIGFGKIAAGYAEDPLTARYYPYATHAQVLRDHPAFDWIGAIDPDPARCQSAQDHWAVPSVATAIEQLPANIRDRIEVAVLATPPDARLACLDHLPNLKAVLVEKPLGTTQQAAVEFVQACNARGIAVQVNLWRRADETFRTWAEGQLLAAIGQPQAALAVYGNGFLNNGTHLLDVLRMLLGEIAWVQMVAAPLPSAPLPIPGDRNLCGQVGLRSGLIVSVQALDFADYREVSLEVWGDRGKLAIWNEGLNSVVIPRSPNRAISEAFELDYDHPQQQPTTVGHALYRMYDNLAAALAGQADLWSSGASALVTAQAVQAAWDSADQVGMRMAVEAAVEAEP